jgi:hypothetical protein
MKNTRNKMFAHYDIRDFKGHRSKASRRARRATARRIKKQFNRAVMRAMQE